jgi:TetR/AcrR family transcriptional repressor of nem operon
MVGATILARAMVDPALSKEILTETLAWIDDETDRAASVPAEPE